MSDAELNRVQRYGGTRLVIFSYAVRIVGAGVGACAAALGVFGFLSLTGGTSQEDNLPSTNELYMGVNLLWFIVLGLLTFFAEIRVGFVKETILKPFGFLHSYVGRANFYLFFGSIVTSSGQQNSYALAEGIMIVVLGVIQLLMAFFMSKKPKTGTKKPYESVAPPGTTPSPPSGPSAPAGPGGPSSKADFSSASAATPSLGATGTKSQHSTDGASSTDNPFLNV